MEFSVGSIKQSHKWPLQILKKKKIKRLNYNNYYYYFLLLLFIIIILILIILFCLYFRFYYFILLLFFQLCQKLKVINKINRWKGDQMVAILSSIGISLENKQQWKRNLENVILWANEVNDRLNEGNIEEYDLVCINTFSLRSIASLFLFFVFCFYLIVFWY